MNERNDEDDDEEIYKVTILFAFNSIAFEFFYFFYYDFVFFSYSVYSENALNFRI